MAPEHWNHGEHGEGDVHGDVDGSALAERRNIARLDLHPIRDLVDAPRRRPLSGFSRRVATDGAATPRFNRSTASAEHHQSWRFVRSVSMTLRHLATLI